MAKKDEKKSKSESKTPELTKAKKEMCIRDRFPYSV